MGETQEVERPRLRSSWCVLWPQRAGRSQERHQTRLVRMNRQTVLGKPFRQHLQHPASVVLTSKTHDQIIRIPNEESTAPQTRLHHLLEPLVQHVVQVDVR